jgi:2'-5' RNA ligase
MSLIRAFIAIELPADIKAALKGLQIKLKQPAASSVKWVDPPNIHLTLKFLGNITPAQTGPVCTAMQSVAQSTRPFQLQVGAAGAFPDLKRVQVIWVGLAGEIDVLLVLQKNLDSHLAKLAFPPEIRPFSAHLTLGRVRETATLIEKQIIGNSISTAKMESSLAWPVKALNLMQSQLTPRGPIYTCLKSVEL